MHLKIIPVFGSYIFTRTQATNCHQSGVSFYDAESQQPGVTLNFILFYSRSFSYCIFTEWPFAGSHSPNIFISKYAKFAKFILANQILN